MSDELILFVEKTHRLETSAFWSWVSSKKGAPVIERIIEGDWLAHDGLSTDALDAFCLNLRFLIQDRDGFSIRNIRSISDKWPESCTSLQHEIKIATEKLDTELNKSSVVQIFENKKTSNRDLFDIVFYGGITHSNPDKRHLFKKITRSGLFSFFVFQAFTEVLFHYRNCIQKIAFNIVKYLEITVHDRG
jgi:hypothetical protein